MHSLLKYISWQIWNWITLFLTLGNKQKGNYNSYNRNITPYMHSYYLQDSLSKFKNVKQFSGQGNYATYVQLTTP